MSNLSLPPGFRFHPTDEELILCYLSQKLMKNSSNISPNSLSIIAEVDIYKFDPWDLPEKAAFGEKEWYFFSHRDRKYPNGARPNRAAASGYWKATGTDKQIVATSSTKEHHGMINDSIIGVKKSLVFYKGRPPKGIKTNWIMHEYRLKQKRPINPLQYSSMKFDDWVLCRIYKKPNASNAPMSSTSMMIDHDNQEEEPSSAQDHLVFQRQLHSTTQKPQKSSSFSDLFNAVDYSLLDSFLYNNDHHPIHESGGFDLKYPVMGCDNNTTRYYLESGETSVSVNQRFLNQQFHPLQIQR